MKKQKQTNKKPFLDMCLIYLAWFSINLNILTHNYFCWLVTKISSWAKKKWFVCEGVCVCVLFSQKISIFGEIWNQNGFCDKLPFQKCLLYYVTVKIQKFIQWLINFGNSGLTPLLNKDYGDFLVAVKYLSRIIFNISKKNAKC